MTHPIALGLNAPFVEILLTLPHFLCALVALVHVGGSLWFLYLILEIPTPYTAQHRVDT